MNKNILAITLGGDEYPSSNFRLRQYYPLFDKEGFEVVEFNSNLVASPKLPDIFIVRGILRKLKYQKLLAYQNLKEFKKMIDKSDIIWINKLLKDPRLLDIVSKSGKKIVIDFDDAEWMSSKELFTNTIQIVDAAIAGNSYLKSYAKKSGVAQVIQVPTTIDLEKYPYFRKSSSTKFVIGWLGSHFTNNYLQFVKDDINDFLENNQAELHIISTKFGNLKQDFPNKTKFIEWHKDTYIDQMAEFNVGLMPLPNEEWVNGKCSFKMLQYMGAFIPVIVSPYGMNKEILDKSECGFPAESSGQWKEALKKYYDNHNLQIIHGKEGRNLVENEFDLKSNFNKIKNLFNSLLNDNR